MTNKLSGAGVSFSCQENPGKALLFCCPLSREKLRTYPFPCGLCLPSPTVAYSFGNSKEEPLSSSSLCPSLTLNLKSVFVSCVLMRRSGAMSPLSPTPLKLCYDCMCSSAPLKRYFPLSVSTCLCVCVALQGILTL